ncbi:MAG: glycosyltransferase family 2 protein, partial [Calditrichaeota bacterium]
MSGISAVIITLNEEKNISRCLESVTKVADEIIIIDSFSEDRTVEISKSYSARVEQVEWKGYAKTKNYGNSLATNDYILSIDADEVISPQLVESILSV